MTGLYRFKDTSINSDKYYKVTANQISDSYTAEWGKWRDDKKFKAGGTKIYTASEMQKVLDAKLKAGYIKVSDVNETKTTTVDNKAKLRKVREFFI